MALLHGFIDLATREVVTAAGGVEHLTPVEARLLAYLHTREGQDVGRDELLAEVWGYAAAVQSRAVDTTVHRLRAKIEPVRGRPVHLLRGELGYMWKSAPPPAEGTALPPSSACLGRADELAALDALLAMDRLVTVHGPAGIGKTTLVLNHCRDRDGVTWVAVGAEDRVDTVGRNVGLALGEVGWTEPVEMLAHVRSRGVSLLVFDGAEHAWSGVREILAVWGEQAWMPRVIVVSRRLLGLPREQRLTLGELPRDAAVHLFRTRAQRAGVIVDEVGDVVDRVGGNPLFLEFAAARLPSLGMEGLRRSLAQPLRSLFDGPRALAAAIADSAGDLGETEKQVLLALSVATGPVTLDALVATVGPMAGESAGRLVDASIATLGPLGWRPQFAVRDWVVETTPADTLLEARQARLRWVMGALDTQPNPGSLDEELASALDLLAPEEARSATVRLARRGLLRVPNERLHAWLIRLAAGTDDVAVEAISLLVRSAHRDAALHFARLQALVAAAPTTARRVWEALAELAIFSHAGSSQRLLSCEFAIEFGTDAERLEARSKLAWLCATGDDPARAIEEGTRALVGARLSRTLTWSLLTLNAVSAARQRLGQHAESVADLNEAASIADAAGAWNDAAGSWCNLAKVQVDVGRHGEAERAVQAALRAASLGGGGWLQAWAFLMGALVELDQGHVSTALGWLDAAKAHPHQEARPWYPLLWRLVAATAGLLGRTPMRGAAELTGIEVRYREIDFSTNLHIAIAVGIAAGRADDGTDHPDPEVQAVYRAARTGAPHPDWVFARLAARIRQRRLST